jgi:hypothetical protein
MLWAAPPPARECHPWMWVLLEAPTEARSRAAGGISGESELPSSATTQRSTVEIFDTACGQAASRSRFARCTRAALNAGAARISRHLRLEPKPFLA